MRKLVLGLAMASTALATPATARDDTWYVELDFGAMIVENSDFDDGNTILDSDHGFDAGAIVGHDFGPYRLEAEASYRKADNDTLGLPTRSIGGDANALSFMLNGLLDFGDDDGLQAFLGGGGGVSRVSYNVGSLLDSEDSGFAWQVLAGLRAPLTDTIDVGIKYRYHNVNGLKLTDVAGNTLGTSWRSHSAMGTLTFNFGEPAAPPPPPPPPPLSLIHI
ncbi:MAG: outer membrane beta-barrel protein, partial [Sphingomonadaceae bacterium]|nr:outer membrane beta-barrel protein [Sphingomonadaceae bacterium]